MAVAEEESSSLPCIHYMLYHQEVIAKLFRLVKIIIGIMIHRELIVSSISIYANSAITVRQPIRSAKPQLRSYIPEPFDPPPPVTPALDASCGQD